MDDEFLIESGGWKARISSFGASLRGGWCDGEEVVWAYSGKESKQGGQGDVLIPFPGRLGGAKYVWDGIEYTLPINDKDGPNAIHGFTRLMEWEIIERRDDQVSFGLLFRGIDGYPFSFQAGIVYSVGENGLTCSFHVKNVDSVDIPMAIGFHPYFSVGSKIVDGDELELPFASVLEMERFIPTGKVLESASADFDFYSPKKIGPMRFNDCFLHPEPDCDGLTSVRMRGNGKVVTVWMDKSLPYVVVYSGENLPEKLQRTTLAIEPMSCGSDGFNRPDWGPARLAPGQALTGAWGVRVAAA